MAYILFPLVMFGHTLGRIPVLSILFRQLRKQHLAIPYYVPRLSVRSPASSMMEMMEYIALHSTLSEKIQKWQFKDYSFPLFRTTAYQLFDQKASHPQPAFPNACDTSNDFPRALPKVEIQRIHLEQLNHQPTLIPSLGICGVKNPSLL